MQKIMPYIWLEEGARECAAYYASIFPDSKILSDIDLPNPGNGDSPFNEITVSLWGTVLQIFSGGQLFERNPSFSYIVACDTVEEVDKYWQNFIEGGQALVPLDKYPWSSRYGWLSDRFGLSWQFFHDTNLSDAASTKRKFQRISTFLLFVGNLYGRAEEAMRYYCKVFKEAGFDAEVYEDQLSYYGEGHEFEQADKLEFARFKLADQEFVFSESGLDHKFTFNEMQSIVILTSDQKESDFFSNTLSSVKESEQCGWIKDKFGISWQIVPTAFIERINTFQGKHRDWLMQTILPMKRIQIDKLERLDAIPPNSILVQCDVKLPIEEVWKAWTSPQRIVKWHFASEDWYCPEAQNDLTEGGQFSYTMASRDGKNSFHFEGIYDLIIEHSCIAYTLGDGRKVLIEFFDLGDATKILEYFVPENLNSVQHQEYGWQMILNNFKAEAEKQ